MMNSIPKSFMTGTLQRCRRRWTAVWLPMLFGFAGWMGGDALRAEPARIRSLWGGTEAKVSIVGSASDE